MAHFARLDENNIVTIVTVVSNDDMIDDNGNEVEALGVAVCEAVVGAGPWVQTSYNGNLRKRYAGIGFTYDANADVFIAPKPEAFPSWVLNDDFDWVAPVPKPEGNFTWDEETQTWQPVPILDHGPLPTEPVSPPEVL